MNDEGHKTGDDTMGFNEDGLEVTIDLTVLYRIVSSEAPRLLKETGDDYETKLFRQLTPYKIRDNAVYYGR